MFGLNESFETEKIILECDQIRYFSGIFAYYQK